MNAKECCSGIDVNGMRTQMLSFVDNIAIRAQDEINLKRASERLNDILKSNYKLRINRKKIRSYYFLQKF
jgi:predicted nucleotidyltransferase